MNETKYYKFLLVPSSTAATVLEFREATMGESGNFALLDTLLAGIEIQKCEVVLTDGVYSLVFTKVDGTTLSAALPAFSTGGTDGGTSVVVPVITAEETDAGVTITITDGSGSSVTELWHGTDGVNGVDGVSPTAVVEQTSTGALITITDANGTTSAVINHGTSTTEDGTAVNGYSPIAVVEQTDTGALITITDINGTTSATVTDGKDGTDGTDGVGISKIEKTAGDGSAGTTDTYTITLTDETTAAFTVYNGKDGSDGADGTDASVVVDSSVTTGGTNAVNSAAVIAYVDSVLGDFETAAAQMDALIGG